MTGLTSEYSMGAGGITSKRSHKHLVDGGQPCQSKQDTEVDADEPADPMLEAPPDDVAYRLRLAE